MLDFTRGMLAKVSDEIQETLRIETPDPGTLRVGPSSVLRQRYRLDSEIGRGGMGIVYRATDLERLAAYAELVADCQAPHFNREAERLTRMVK